MAQAIDFCGSNKRLVPAPGTEDMVGNLHVHTNGREVISCWKLTPEELAHVNRTGEIWLSVASGKTAPPVYIAGFPMMEATDLDTGQLTDYHSNGQHVIDDARRFAIHHHGMQKYGDEPYGYHLGKVVQVLIDFGADWKLIASAWLHDTEEDCWEDLPMLDRRQIVGQRFGALIEGVVWACTGEMFILGEKQNRAQRNAQIYAKVHDYPPAAPVKQGDRIANMEECAKTKSSMGKVYLDETLDFDAKVGVYTPPPMRIRMLKAALAIHDYTGDTKKTTRAQIEAKLAEVEALIHKE